MERQNIALFGATTQIGRNILNEALNRGHKVTAFVPDPTKLPTNSANLKVLEGDITKKHNLSEHIKGYDVVISTYQPQLTSQQHLITTLGLKDAVKAAGVKQLIVFGHPGNDKIERATPFPGTTEVWISIADTQRKMLDALKNEKELNWSYIYYPEIESCVKKNIKPIISDEMSLASSLGDHRFYAEKHAESILNYVESIREEQNAEL